MRTSLKAFSEEIIQKSGVDVLFTYLKDEITYKQSSIYYKASENQIYFQEKIFFEEHENFIKKTKVPLSLEDAALFTICHELGHATDFFLKYNISRLNATMEKATSLFTTTRNKERVLALFKKAKKINLSFEKKAWEKSKRFLPNNYNKEHWDIYKNNCLSSYEVAFDKYINDWIEFLPVREWFDAFLIKNYQNCRFTFEHEKFDPKYIFSQKDVIFLSIPSICKKIRESKDLLETQKELFSLLVSTVFKKEVSSYPKWTRRLTILHQDYKKYDHTNNLERFLQTFQLEKEMRLEQQQAAFELAYSSITDPELQKSFQIYMEKEQGALHDEFLEKEKKIYRKFNEKKVHF